MKVLDIDLDFFQFGRGNFIPNSSKNRLTYKQVQPWSKEATIEFLEKRCHLSKHNKIKGCIVEQHHDLFHRWNNMIANNRLVPPFTVDHVDAHADLGMGDTSWCYIMGELLHYPPDQRSDIPVTGSEKLNCGNYLAYAIANRWLDKLNFIINPNWQDDIPGCYVIIEERLFYQHYNFKIQLKKYSPEQIEDMGMTRADPEHLGYEPEIPFEIILHEEFDAMYQYDYICLATSPSYTTPETDNLIPIIMDYMDVR